MRSRHHEIRETLRNNPDGMTILELSAAVDMQPGSLKNSLKAMPDTYIDRWTKAKWQRQWQAVWCSMAPPPDCPRPDRKTQKKESPH